LQLHKSLKRQLSNTHLDVDSVPNTLEDWHAFLERVNNFYNEADEERYLLERSMDLSSHEIMELNEQLEKAQEIAELGYWHYNVVTGKVTWSRELRKIFGLSDEDDVPDYEGVLQLVHPEYQKILDEHINRAIQYGTKYAFEMQYRKKGSDKYRWMYALGAPFQGHSPPYKELSGIAMDITLRKESEIKLNELNQKLIDSARQVGMADVAVGVLHNVGNVLNSTNVSTGLLVESFKNSHFEKFFAICELITAHQDDFVNYIKNDEKGKLLPRYIVALGESLREVYKTMSEEVNNIDDKVHVIRDIVMAQQDLTNVKNHHEKVNLIEVVRHTILMAGIQFSKCKISIQEDYQELPEMYIDRARLVQILMNLLQNAKDAINESGNTENNYIIISIKKSEEDRLVRISVKDNGVGISPDNISKVFVYGFTTKRKGHGIGLHSCAIAAKEMHGKLSANSEGPGKGAEFILELPWKPDK
jgi:PAS domain S-box-containing protein